MTSHIRWFPDLYQLSVMRSYFRLSASQTLTLAPVSSTGQALSHDGRGDKWAFDRLKPNVLPHSHTDTPVQPQTRGVMLLRVEGVSLGF